MPELPEVETIKRGLESLLLGKRIVSVSHDNPKSFPNAAADVDKFVIGAQVIEVRRRAKVLLIELDSKYSLVTHLKMTGQMVYRSKTTNFGAGHPNDSLIGELPDKSTRVVFEFSDNSKLFFNDFRKFGWIRLIPTAEVPQINFFISVGPEPLSGEFSWQELHDRLQRRKNTNIKAALLDQSVVAGLGNIYVDETLWMAKVHPETLVRNVREAKVKLLYESMRAILQLSIDKGGSSDKNYVDAEGKRGSYLEFANVFRREGQACSRCGAIIVKTRVAGRGTHTCPRCQKTTTA